MSEIQKDIAVLGLHKDPWHNTGACAIRRVDGNVEIAYVAEERLDRVKDSRAFPSSSIEACSAEVGISSVDEYDVIVLDYIENDTNWRLDQFRRPCSTSNLLAGLDQKKIRIINHHLAHAYAVFYSCPFDEAAILVVDGRGSEKETQSLYIANSEGIRLISKTSSIGIGLAYAAATQAIGFKLLQEGKTMGLAPYGAGVTEGDRIFDFQSRFEGIETDYSNFCENGGYSILTNVGEMGSFERQARGAFEIQEEAERAMMHLAKYAKDETNSNFLCLTGGVALNSVANHKLVKSGLFDDIFVNPAASDTGIPLGAALYGFHNVLEQPKMPFEISPYLGPSYSSEAVGKAVALFDGFEVIREGAMDKACSLLLENKIVARFEGRSEMGPRALGHRSILMSPLHASNKDVLNARVKFREAFRPFAPAVLEDRAEEFFEVDRPCPYMLMIPKVKEGKETVIPAITHVDGTARLQTVTRDRNGAFYDLIEMFGEKSGVPVIINTSFNVAGEPIVETPEDAIKCFLMTSIDALLLDDLLLVKE